MSSPHHISGTVYTQKPLTYSLEGWSDPMQIIPRLAIKAALRKANMRNPDIGGPQVRNITFNVVFVSRGIIQEARLHWVVERKGRTVHRAFDYKNRE